jgi:hypothetical protein
MSLDSPKASKESKLKEHKILIGSVVLWNLGSEIILLKFKNIIE